MYDQSYCQRPDGSGTVMRCNECFRVYGSRCQSTNNCYESSGCDFKVGQNMERDDIMSVGFVPEYFTPPLTVTITAIRGTDFTEEKLCPTDAANSATFNDAYAAANSVDVNMFMTLTQVEKMGADSKPSASAALRSGQHPHLVVVLGLLGLARWLHRLF